VQVVNVAGANAVLSGLLFDGATGGGPTFPLRVGTDLRHLVDQGDVPFLVNGDAAWSLIVGLQKPDVSVYLADRRAKGFNTILVNLIEHYFAVDPPRNAYGDGPFTTPGDFSTPNESYFAHADWVINEAASRGMLVLLTPAYLGFGCGAEGWCQEMNANGTTKMFNYGVFLGNRYKNFKNIIWVHGGDTNANAYPGTGDIMRAVINGIKSLDGPRVHTAHCGPETSALDCYNEAWLDVNTTYSGCSKSAVRTQTDYNRARMMPFFYIEGKYENEGASDVCLRSQAYWSILGGSSGEVFGNNPIWLFTGPAWQQALNSPGAQSMANVGALFRSRAWQTLVPDYLHQVVTAGYGDVNNATYASAARASDGSMAIAYLPVGGTITVDMSRLSRSATARWYDPVAGTFTAIAGSPFPNAGSRNFTTPGNNAGGSVDWVLVLEITP
jgi:hypothetical protein